MSKVGVFSSNAEVPVGEVEVEVEVNLGFSLNQNN